MVTWLLQTTNRKWCVAYWIVPSLRTFKVISAIVFENKWGLFSCLWQIVRVIKRRVALPMILSNLWRSFHILIHSLQKNCVLLTLERSLSTGPAAVSATGRSLLLRLEYGTVAAWHEKTGTVIRPVQAVSEDIFIRTVRPWRIVNCLIAPPRNILTYLLTYLLTP